MQAAARLQRSLESISAGGAAPVGSMTGARPGAAIMPMGLKLIMASWLLSAMVPACCSWWRPHPHLSGLPPSTCPFMPTMACTASACRCAHRHTLSETAGHVQGLHAASAGP